MIAGGASGNLFDRIYYAAVPDFIDLSINNYHWFIFNIADIFISVGVIVLIILEFLKRRLYEKNHSNNIIFIFLTACQSTQNAFTLKKNQVQMNF